MKRKHRFTMLSYGNEISISTMPGYSLSTPIGETTKKMQSAILRGPNCQLL